MEKIVYELTSEDLINYTEYLIQRNINKSRRYLLYVLYGLFVIYVLYKEYESGYSWESLIWVLFVIMFMAAILLFTLKGMSFIVRLTMKRSIRQNPKAIGKRECWIDDNMLKIKSEYSETSQVISSISDIEETKNYIFLFTGKSSAMFIPKRVFRDSISIQNFKEFFSKSTH